MPVERTSLERLLEHTLGFVRKEGDHHWFYLFVDGQVVATTRTSHSSHMRTIDDTLLGKIARRDLHISLPFLKALLAGKKTRDDYLNELKKQASK